MVIIVNSMTVKKIPAVGIGNCMLMRGKKAWGLEAGI